MKIELRVLDKEFYNVKPLPAYQSPGAAAMDLILPENLWLEPGEKKLVPLGIAIHIKDPNIVGKIYPRSSGGLKGLVLANLVGVIDSDFKEELQVCLWNTQLNTGVELFKGGRIAQIIFEPIIRVSWNVVEEFSDPAITRGGWGSTGDK